MRRIALILLLFLATGCDQEIGTVGLDLGTLFPERTDWFWKYNNTDVSEVSFWHNQGNTSPDGEDWTTFRVWVDGEQAIIDDIGDTPDDVGEPEDAWVFKAYWAERGNGWYFMGFSANPDGAMQELGQVFYEGDGIPFALSDVTTGVTWETEANGNSWTTSPVKNEDEITFNGQSYDGSWEITIESDTGDTPFEGHWTLMGGPGIIRWDVNAFRHDEATGAPWRHVRNADWSDVLGADI